MTTPEKLALIIQWIEGGYKEGERFATFDVTYDGQGWNAQAAVVRFDEMFDEDTYVTEAVSYGFACDTLDAALDIIIEEFGLVVDG